MTRREAILRYTAWLAASPLLRAQTAGSFAPLQELLNAFEFETVAQRKLAPAIYDEIAGGDRRAFDRITFRPRLMVNTTKLDLSVALFGQNHFAPILVGPLSEQTRFHPEGELAMLRGASAARTAVVISSRSSHPIAQLATQAKTTLWYQIFPAPDMLARAREGVEAGCTAICLTLGAAQSQGIDWNGIAQLREKLGVPLLLKGIVSPQAARTAVKLGVQGIVVSSYPERAVNGAAAPIEMLPAIADAVAGGAKILIDGGFRRGSDVLKALALGAHAVLLGRPALWGLAAYGADGVERVLELLQTELARDMAMCGRPDFQSIDRGMVKIHHS